MNDIEYLKFLNKHKNHKKILMSLKEYSKKKIEFNYKMIEKIDDLLNKKPKINNEICICGHSKEKHREGNITCCRFFYDKIEEGKLTKYRTYCQCGEFIKSQ